MPWSSSRRSGGGLVIGRLGNGEALLAVRDLSAENERLRMFNVRRQRRFDMPAYLAGTKVAKPDWEACIMAEHLLGVPKDLIAAIWMQENGPPDIELGSVDKTDFFAEHLPLKYWNAMDGGRTANRLLWKWLMETKDGQRVAPDALQWVAGPYTALDEQAKKDWAKRVLKFYRLNRKEH